MAHPTQIHVKFEGHDWWGNPVYRCIENGLLYKDVDWIPGNIILNSFDNSDFDAEADCQIYSDIEIILVEEEETDESILGLQTNQ